MNKSGKTNKSGKMNKSGKTNKVGWVYHKFSIKEIFPQLTLINGGKVRATKKIKKCLETLIS